MSCYCIEIFFTNVATTMPLICGDFFSETLDTAGLNNDENKSLLKSLSYAKCFLQWK